MCMPICTPGSPSTQPSVTPWTWPSCVPASVEPQRPQKTRPQPGLVSQGMSPLSPAVQPKAPGSTSA